MHTPQYFGVNAPKQVIAFGDARAVLCPAALSGFFLTWLLPSGARGRSPDLNLLIGRMQTGAWVPENLHTLSDPTCPC